MLKKNKKFDIDKEFETSKITGQKNVPVFKRFFLQPYIRLCRTSEFRDIIMENGINLICKKHQPYFSGTDKYQPCKFSIQCILPNLATGNDVAERS